MDAKMAQLAQMILVQACHYNYMAGNSHGWARCLVAKNEDQNLVKAYLQDEAEYQKEANRYAQELSDFLTEVGKP